MSASAVIAVVFALAFHGCALFLVRGLKLTTRDICAAGLVIAATMVLESIYVPLPTGTTICLLSPVPLMLLALVWDHRVSIVAGWGCAILSLLLLPTWQMVHWGQFFVEHLVCFSCLGFAGVFGASRARAVWGVILASLLRTAGHVVSGVVFFSQNAWDGWGAWGYSLSYNLSQTVPLCVLSAVVVVLMPLPSLRRSLRKEG